MLDRLLFRSDDSALLPASSSANIVLFVDHVQLLKEPVDEADQSDRRKEITLFRQSHEDRHADDDWDAIAGPGGHGVRNVSDKFS